LSISAKLADYEATWELLNRLNLSELKRLAHRNNIALQKEDIHGNIQKARSKEEVTDVLVASEFKESDVIELLGISRLTKEELLNTMSIRQLKRLARETGILLEKSTIFGTRKAAKKKDIVKTLRVLATSKVRQYAEKTGLIKKATKKTKKRKPTKVAMRKPAKKTIARGKIREAKAIEPRISKPFLTVVESARIEEKKQPVAIMVPTQRAPTRTARIIEETIKERLVEREIVRKQVALGQRQERGLAKEREEEKMVVEAKKAKKKN
jgi:hypothetical protein